jgi:hypothetical protein
MSKQNKVNKSNYDQAGRLTPDEMARERKKMHDMKPGREGISREEIKGQQPHDERASNQDRSEREESE